MALDYTRRYCGAADIRESTRSYERWLGRHVRLMPADLRRTHTRMAESPFVLAEQRRWLREIALGELRDPTWYWTSIARCVSSGG